MASPQPDRSPVALPPGVYLVPTPIGNLADITLRALDTLRQADRIACEDTRHSLKLLTHYGIQRPLVSLHQHNEHQRVDELVRQVAQSGERLAVVTDAGTPGISDPGFLVARAALAHQVHLEVLPGATALVPALLLSGLAADRFAFEGFLPPKKGRQTRLVALATEPRTLVLYESPHRLVKTLGELAHHLGPERPAAVVRELTKLHEECLRGSLAELATLLGARGEGGVKGECVVVIAGLDA